MKNKFLYYLLKNEPNKVMSKSGYKFRKFISPPVRNLLAPATSPNKYHIGRRDNLPTDRPLIFACTHQVKDDIALALASAGRHTYLLFASLPDFFGTLDGPALWLNGVILVDRKDKDSRSATIPKMKYAIDMGADILMYPEGTLNKTENLIVQKLFPGVYYLAKDTNAFAAFITNLGKYNEGELVGEWVKFPTTAEELKEVFKRIGIGQKRHTGLCRGSGAAGKGQSSPHRGNDAGG